MRSVRFLIAAVLLISILLFVPADSEADIAVSNEAVAEGLFGEDGASWAYHHEAGSDECTVSVSAGAVRSMSEWTVSRLTIGSTVSTDPGDVTLSDLVSGYFTIVRIEGDITGAGNLNGLGPNSIVDASGCRTVPDSMFKGCSSLRSVRLSNVSNIGPSAFEGCFNLISVALGGGSSRMSVGVSAFEGCTSLYTIDLGEGVVSVGDAAFKGSKVSSIAFPATLTVVGAEAFADTTTLRAADMSSPVSVLGDSAFRSCTRLVDLVFPSGLATIGPLCFSGCTGIAELSLPSGVVSVGASAFSGCTSLKRIVMTSHISLGDSAFSGCTSLSSIDLGSSPASIGASCFSGCTSLSTIDISTASVDKTSFSGCTSLSSIAATGSGLYESRGGILYSNNVSVLYMAPPAMTSSLYRSDLPSSVRTINLDYSSNSYYIDQNGAYSAVEFVTAITQTSCIGVLYSSLGMSECVLERSGPQVVMKYTLYPGWTYTGSDVYSVGADVAGGDGRIAISMSGSSCTVYPMGLSTLTYAQLDAVTEMDGWPSEWSLSLTSSSYAQQGLSGTVKDVQVPTYRAVAYKGSSSECVLESAVRFHGMTFAITSVSIGPKDYGALTDLTIGDGIAIPESAFADSVKLRTVIADHVDEVGRSAFRNCISLESASFQGCSVFREYAFDNCRSLGSLILGGGQVSFGSGSLWTCTALRMLVTGMSAEVSGTGLPVAHIDQSVVGCSFSAGSNCMFISCSSDSEVLVSSTPDRESAVTYRFCGGTAVAPLSSSMYVWLEAGTQTDGVVVVFDNGIGKGYTEMTVASGSKIDAIDAPAVHGYTFLHWTAGSGEFDFDDLIEKATLLTAVYQREESSEGDELLLAAMVVVAVFVIVLMPVVFDRFR